MTFESLGLLPQLLQTISGRGYTEPTPIQAEAIPVILRGRDVMGGAQTGTGKTAGFTLPLLQLLDKRTKGGKERPIRALILTPTRELAAQVGENVYTYGKDLSLKSTVIFGGVAFGPQAKRLRRGVDILISTPGRLLDHANQKTVDLSQVDIVVLDEADRMLDMGFIHDIRKILQLTRKQRQTLLFSATFSPQIRKLSEELLNDPVTIEVARSNAAAEQVEQLTHPVDRERKTELLTHLIKSQNWRQALVFTRTKHGANKLTQHLEKSGITATAIHGNKTQGARTQALKSFKEGRVRILVATDVAARGLDVPLLPHVVNFELPEVAEDYVHRIGRTGRAGADGEAISLVCIDERRLLGDIERLLGKKLPKVVIPEFEPNPSVRPQPIRQRPGGGGRRPAARPKHPRGATEARGRRPKKNGGHRKGSAPAGKRGKRGPRSG